MGHVVLQTIEWIGAGAALIAYLGRRRKRKMEL
jgi:hypothetical protein